MIGDSISEKARQETETQRNKALAKARQGGKVKTRVIAELKARELAQVEEDARYRQEATARARASADERRKREDEARDAAESILKTPRNWPKTVGHRPRGAHRRRGRGAAFRAR